MLVVTRWKGALLVKQLALLHSLHAQAHWFCKMAGIRDRLTFNLHNDLGRDRVINALYHSLPHDPVTAAAFPRWELSAAGLPMEPDVLTLLRYSPQRLLADPADSYTELLPGLLLVGTHRTIITHDQYFNTLILTDDVPFIPAPAGAAGG